MATVGYAHIDIDSAGVPYLQGTQTKVMEVVLDRLAYHWDADEIHRQHPHLSLGQIYSALGYYYDHQAEMDAAIEASLRRARNAQAGQLQSPVLAKLRSNGLLS